MQNLIIFLSVQSLLAYLLVTTENATICRVLATLMFIIGMLPLTCEVLGVM